MKRDDLDLAVPGPGAEATLPPVTRHPHYFGPGADATFGWYHHAERPIARDCVAVICAPIGPEYTRSHRTLRHLADRLARCGVPALRFDYHGIGDSPGDENDANRFDHWKRSIATAVAHARDVSGCERVCLIGVRLGATLAALDAEEVGADLAVLWNPVVKGRAYARELQAIAMTAKRSTADNDDGLESAGFRISTQTLETLKEVDLTHARFKAGVRVLLVGRDDLAGDQAFAEHLAASGIANDMVTVPGWNEMMADHQFTVVPDAALATIVDWVVAHSLARPAQSRAPATDCRRTLSMPGVEEHLCHFGEGGHLFGILTRPAEDTGQPAIVMLNAGSIHRVGPHRLYVRLARELAAAGYPVLRVDHEGLGDSVLRGAGRENHPYPPSAMADLEAAFDFLRQGHGYERFYLMGLCSGAHTAFHAARQLRSAPIERAILINPWYFYWSEGMSLDTSVNHYEDVAAYQQSMRDPARWKKLLRGEVDLVRLARVTTAHLAKTLKGRWDDVREILAPSSGTRLSKDLRDISGQGRTLNLYVSDGEPAPAILATEAKRAVRSATRAGRMTIDKISGGDHTFSQGAPRDELIRRIVRDLAPRPRPATLRAMLLIAGAVLAGIVAPVTPTIAAEKSWGESSEFKKRVYPR